MYVSALMEQLRRALSGWRSQGEAGQGLVEYALIFILAVLLVIVLVTMIGPWVGNVFSNVVNYL